MTTKPEEWTGAAMQPIPGQNDLVQCLMLRLRHKSSADRTGESPSKYSSEYVERKRKLKASLQLRYQSTTPDIDQDEGEMTTPMK